jgi:hypothetical protein
MHTCWLTSMVWLLACQGLASEGLSAAERAAGWKLLFDGRTPAGWRGYKQQTFPMHGWKVENGTLMCLAGMGGGDIVTNEEYGDFELLFEWRVADKGNSGVMYRVTEKHDAPWHSGPEFQILDDGGAGVAAGDVQSAGAVFDLYAPSAGKTLRPAGEFNQGRIVLRDGQLGHWVNGVKVVDCRIDGDDWKQRVRQSKFAAFSGFGAARRGRICLQDHGDTVWFRNIRIRDLSPSAKMPKEVALFNGKDLSGWTATLPEGAKMEDVWHVDKDGVLVCKGVPAGYIRTEKDYRNFVLKLEWRFSPVTRQAGNSGVLLRVQPPDKVWPKSVEAQLQSENAGDFWNIDEFPMKTEPARLSGRNTKKTHMAERPVGEWNEYEIIVDHGNIILIVNGEELNRAWDVQEIAGKIGLQSEGAEIHFRNIRLAPID